jgi:hypothetical protein
MPKSPYPSLCARLTGDEFNHVDGSACSRQHDRTRDLTLHCGRLHLQGYTQSRKPHLHWKLSKDCCIEADLSHAVGAVSRMRHIGGFQGTNMIPCD